MKNKFLHTDITELGISKFRFYSGLILGFLTSLFFYGFLYGLRETVRIFTITEESDIWILSDSEVNFYNLIFAFIAVIFGHYVCISHWLDTPRRWKDRIFRRRVAIINDHRANVWFYISWFLRITTLLGFLYCLSFKYWYYAFEIFPKYNSLLILIIIVLYINSWNTTRLIFKNRSYKWTLYSLILTIGLAFSLSKINLIDYKEINKNVLSNSVYNNYTLNIPRTNFHERLNDLSLVFNLYVAESKDFSKNTILWADGEEINLRDISLKVAEKRGLLSEIDQMKMTIKLNIHSETKMHFVNELKKELSQCWALKIAYSVAPLETDIDSRYYRNHVIISKLLPINDPFINSAEYFDLINTHKNPIIIKHTNYKDSINYNGSLVQIDHLPERLKVDISGDPEYLIKYYFKDSLNYENYLSVISSVKLTIKELRDTYSLEHFSMKYDDLYWEDSKELKRLFQYRLLEVNEEFARKLDK